MATIKARTYTGAEAEAILGVPSTIECRADGDTVISLNWADRVASYARVKYKDDSKTLWAGSSQSEWITMLDRGQDSLVAKSYEILDSLAEIEFPEYLTSTRTLQADVMGARLSVGAHLSGSPIPFRRRKGTLSSEPLDVVIDIGANVDVQASMMLVRGICALAIVQRAQVNRAVTLWTRTYNANLGWGQNSPHNAVLVKVGVAPLDVSAVAVAIGHPSMPRRWLYKVQQHCIDKVPSMRGASDALPAPYRSIGLESMPCPYIVPRLDRDDLPHSESPKDVLDWILCHDGKPIVRT